MLAFHLCFISHVNIVLSDMLDLRSPYKQSAGLFVPAMCACAYILARSPSNLTAIRYIDRKRAVLWTTPYSIWRKRWDSNPRAREDYLISSQARYDHFDTLPYSFVQMIFYFVFLIMSSVFYQIGNNRIGNKKTFYGQ